jgi:hypothetical protein
MKHLWGRATNYRNTYDANLGYYHGFPNIGLKSLHLAIRARLLWKTLPAPWIKQCLQRPRGSNATDGSIEKGADAWRRAT